MGFINNNKNIETRMTWEELINGIEINGNYLNIPSLSGGVNLISDLVSTLNFRLYKKTTKDRVTEVKKDYRLRLLNKEPNNLMTGQNIKRAWIKDLILNGETYTFLEKTGNTVNGLYYVESQNVNVLLDNGSIHKNATLQVDGKDYNLFDFIIMVNNSKNGVEGKGVIQENKDLLDLALKTQTLLSKIFSKNNIVTGVFSTDKSLGRDEFDQFKNSVNKVAEGESNAIALNKGTTFTPISTNNKDQQVLESMIDINNQIRDLLKIPTNISTTEGYKYFIKNCINTWVKIIEDSVNRSLLLETEKDKGYYFEIDMDSISKADVLERFNAYALGLNNGIFSVNEVRTKEGMETVEGLDIHKLSLGETYFNQNTGKMYVPNTNSTVSMEGDVVDETENVETKEQTTE